MPGYGRGEASRSLGAPWRCGRRRLASITRSSRRMRPRSPPSSTPRVRARRPRGNLPPCAFPLRARSEPQRIRGGLPLQQPRRPAVRQGRAGRGGAPLPARGPYIPAAPAPAPPRCGHGPQQPLGTLQLKRGRPRVARKLLREALAILEPLLSPLPSSRARLPGESGPELVGEARTCTRQALRGGYAKHFRARAHTAHALPTRRSGTIRASWAPWASPGWPMSPGWITSGCYRLRGRPAPTRAPSASPRARARP